MNYMDKIKESIRYIKEKTKMKPSIGLILGSGLGSLGERIKNPTIIEYKDIPNFPISTVKGHKGQLIIGQLGDKDVIAMQGRFHYYEGYPLDEVVFPIRVIIGLGIKNLIVTNAAGGVDESFKPGDLMIINDHINFTGQNPLRGKNLEELGPRFVDMTLSYDKALIALAKNIGGKLNISLKEGVYMWFTGPTYETPAEVKLARTLGASAVGMSTVPEVIVATHQGIKVLGISCITNMAAGVLDKPLNHEEVIETSLMVKDKFEKLVIEILANM
ncbi:MAG: purine-nucleoside phosphorylase [Tissierellia bacterium]|nr:purine-nucleoside phosphorylase [Tissierellia bacterium]